MRQVCVKMVLALAMVWATAMGVCAAPAEPPSLDLVLAPHLQGGAVDSVDGRMTIQSPNVAADAPLLRMPLIIVSIPTARYDGDALKARDDDGDLKLEAKDEAPTPTGTYRQWFPTRATKGNVVVSFKAPPRIVSASTRTGPLFDLRAEAGGVNGAGISFLPLPDAKTLYNINLQWDLSGMPKGSRGVSSLGEGNVRTVGPTDVLAFSFYFAGPVKSFPPDGSGDFAMYWLSDPVFDLGALAQRVRQLYAYMSKFFHEEGAPYRVFIRKNPHKAGGGTALRNSFVFGWSDASAPSLDNLQELLSHEMAHNWPSLDGEHGDTAWYTEGTAEFYSLLLSNRAGAMSSDRFLEAINGRAEGYYTNPYRNATNAEAAKHFWTDWSAQRVPYGRGFMYLIQVDSKIRAKTKGRRSLDDIVIAIRARQKSEKSYTIADWLKLVTGELGPDAKRDYDAMVAGTTLVPPANAFAPCFRPEKTQVRPFALGFDSAQLRAEPKVVRGLVAGSAAAAAGLRDDDEIIEASDDLEVQKDPAALMRLKVRRRSEVIEISYLPRGDAIDAYHWVRETNAADECRL